MINAIRIKRILSLQWLYIVIMPMLLFPIISLLSIIFDWVFGDAERVLQIIHGSKRQILYQYITDWSDSLVLSAILIWVIFTPIYLILKRKEITKKANLFISGLLIWFVIGIVLYHFNLTGIFLISITGFLMTAGLITLQRMSDRN